MQVRKTSPVPCQQLYNNKPRAAQRRSNYRNFPFHLLLVMRHRGYPFGTVSHLRYTTTTTSTTLINFSIWGAVYRARQLKQLRDTLMELNQISKSEDIGALRLLYDRVEAILAKPTRNWSPSWHVRDISNANNYHRKPILYVYLIGFLWYHGVERNISKCMGWNQLWRYLGEYWNKLNFTCLICSWSLSWSLVAISSHFNRF